MTPKREAIIFIPGYDSKKRGVRLQEVVSDLKAFNSIGVIEVSEDTALYGHTGYNLKVNYDNGTSRQIDIYEAFWADLRREFETIKPYSKAIQGLATLFYWAHPKTWSFANGNFSKGVFMVSSALMLICWYLLVLATFIAFVKETDLQTSIAWIDNTFRAIVDCIPDFKYLLALSVLTGFLPLDQVANISYNGMLYLKKDEVRNAMRRRVHDIAYDVVHQTDQYDRITILSHSFGSAVGVHFVSEMQLDIERYQVRFITLGAAISFMSSRSDWLKDVVKECFTKRSVDEWIDFFSMEDWVCSSVRLETQEGKYNSKGSKSDGKFFSKQLKFTSNMLEQFVRASTIHKLYTKSSEVVNTILS